MITAVVFIPRAPAMRGPSGSDRSIYQTRRRNFGAAWLDCVKVAVAPSSYVLPAGIWRVVLLLFPLCRLLCRFESQPKCDNRDSILGGACRGVARLTTPKM